MMKKRLLVLICFGLISSLSYCLIYQKTRRSNIQSHINYAIGPHFYPVPISKFNESNLPCLPIEIEGKKADFVIDLGFNGHVCMSDEFLRQIEHKKYSGTTTIYNFHGLAHERAVYEIPEIQIGEFTFHHPDVEEMNINQHIETTFTKENTPPMEEGRFGWKMFKNSNVFLDLGHSMFAFCDSIDSLKKEGYSTEPFVKLPMSINHGMIELKAEVNGGFFTCLLDTGSTFNLLQEESEIPIEKAIWMPEVSQPQFRISGKEFGPISFTPLPLKLQCGADAILGMPFFETHMVFLDFDKNVIYLAKTIKDV